MFGLFTHPKPESRRAVPELIAEHRMSAPLPRALLLPPPSSPLQAGRFDRQQSVVISVGYRLREYLEFLEQHLAMLRPNVGMLSKLLLRIGGSIAFWIKRRRMGTCTFTFDAAGLRRRSRRGEIASRWGDVLAIRQYTVGLLIEKQTGAYPIPARCLSDDQVNRILQFAGRTPVRPG